MSPFVYLVTEGVHDVAFLGKLLAVVFGAKRIKKLEELPEPFPQWLKTFNWPRKTGKHHDIERLAVPAPEFHLLSSNEIVIIRNAQGITEIHKTILLDDEAFVRLQQRPTAIGIFLDSDEQAPAARFADMTSKLAQLSLPVPVELGAVTSTAPRTGVFSFPEPGCAGTLEDVLLPLGKTAYPELHADAVALVDNWKKKVILNANAAVDNDGSSSFDPNSADWKELRKPAGAKKATLGAMTAILKPGKALQTSLVDNRWLSAPARGIECLKPCIDFLDQLLMPNPSLTPPHTP
ncbi:MAG: hypothetical protein IPM54_01335 [Polyangiaceae bacterium]|nr:hypothetical protein [Polyangiaceae bacterium]